MLQVFIGSSLPVSWIKKVYCYNLTWFSVYIDAGPSSGNIKINIVTSGESFARKWKVKVSQIPCNAQYRAADSCLQYFSGMSGRIKSFNYGDPTVVNTEHMEYGMQLSAQEYSICMRAEEGFCGIVYVPCRDTAEPKGKILITTWNCTHSELKFTLLLFQKLFWFPLRRRVHQVWAWAPAHSPGHHHPPMVRQGSWAPQLPLLPIGPCQEPSSAHPTGLGSHVPQTLGGKLKRIPHHALTGFVEATFQVFLDPHPMLPFTVSPTFYSNPLNPFKI